MKKIIYHHGIDLEAEIMSVLSKEITEELDKGIIYDVLETNRRASLTQEEREAEDIVEILKRKPQIPNVIHYKGITNVDTSYFYCPYLPLLRQGNNGKIRTI